MRFATGTHEHYLVDIAADGSVDVLERPEVASRLAALAGVENECATVRSLGVEQSNSSVMLDELHMLKLYRRLEAGPNPEIEMLRALGEEGFTNAPRLEGALETPGPPLETSLVSITERVSAEGGGWELTVDSLSDDASWLPERAWRLGEVTAGMHGALAAREDDPVLRSGGTELRVARALRRGDRRGDLARRSAGFRRTTRSAPSRTARRTSATSSTSSPPSARRVSRSARTATTTSARCCGRPTPTGSSSTSRASLRARSRNAAASAPRSATSPG